MGYNLIRKTKTFFRLLRESGVPGALQGVREDFARTASVNVTKEMRAAWAGREGLAIPPEAFGMSSRDHEAQRNGGPEEGIRFSILVPLYNTPEAFLREMLASVLLQTYRNWELCIADGSDGAHPYTQGICGGLAAADRRVKYVKLERNLGISGNTNACLELAAGDYVSLFDHDDLLHPSALYETAKAVRGCGAELVYTDEAAFRSPDLHDIAFIHFKRDFSQELLESINYICHFTSFKRSLLEGLRFDPECDGAQDFDIILKVTERTRKVAHVKKCLYYWRASPASTAGGASAKPYTTEAGKRALEKHFGRTGEDAVVCPAEHPNQYRIRYADRNKKGARAGTSFVIRRGKVF